MTDDIVTVMWKEWKGLLRYRGSRARFLLTLLSPVIMATVLPLQAGPAWLEELDSIFLAVFVPVILVAITIPDSFAGERERHTLGTLLASRLPDRAILFGKLAISVAFAWGGTLIMLLVGLVTVNVAHGDGGFLFFSPTVAFADLALSLLLATLAAGAGVLISLRAATVQEATQTLTAVFLIPPMLLGVVLVSLREQVADLLEGLSGEQILLVVLVVLVVADLAVFWTVLARFQRSRLYLD
jgi:ABC-2 type transport system permease protein